MELSADFLNVPEVASKVSLVVTDYFGIIYAKRDLTTSSQSVDFNIYNYPIGTYIVKPICNGNLADVKTFVKQWKWEFFKKEKNDNKYV